MNKRFFILAIVAAAHLLAGCSEPVDNGGTIKGDENGVITPEQYVAAAASANLLLTKRRASVDALAAVKDQETYEKHISGLLKSQDFQKVMITYHQHLFNDLADKVNTSSMKNEAAWL